MARNLGQLQATLAHNELKLLCWESVKNFLHAVVPMLVQYELDYLPLHLRADQLLDIRSISY